MAKCTVFEHHSIGATLLAIDENLDEIMLRALRDGAVIIKEEEEKALARVIGNGTKKESRSTGELEDSIVINEIEYNTARGEPATALVVRFKEPRKNQSKDAHRKHKLRGREKSSRSYDEITNELIAATIEYGRTGQAPKPFMRETKRRFMPKALLAISDAFDAEVNRRIL